MATLDDNICSLNSIISELNEIAQTLAKLEPVSHLSKSAIQFNGGILGGIREYKEGKRLHKLINQPIFKDKSFYNIAGVIINNAEEMVNLLSEIQNELPKEDTRYYDTVTASYVAIMETYSVWYNYSPDMANEGITVEDQENVALGPTVVYLTNKKFSKLDLPETIKKEVNKNESSDGDGKGCFGVIVLFIIGGLASLFATLC